MSQSEIPSIDPLARYAEKQSWFGPNSEVAVQHAIQSGFIALGRDGVALKSFLHGDWLHEPLHSVLTDIPLGAWTATVLFDFGDMIGDSIKLKNAADCCLDLGLVGAAGAAVAGATDWSELEKPNSRRIATTHALLNIGATAIFLTSSLMRKRKKSRGLARLLAVAGYVAASISAHLGGNLVYEHGIGVRDQNARLDAKPGDQEDRVRDPEDRATVAGDEMASREKNLDKTIADSFPTSDPPSSIPNPS